MSSKTKDVEMKDSTVVKKKEEEKKEEKEADVFFGMPYP
jgi:hypothetical protein